MDYDIQKEARKRKLRSDAGKWILAGVILLAAVILLSESVFIVGEAEHGSHQTHYPQRAQHLP